MSDPPNYRFYSNPRFSVNHVAEYISADNANQRETVIRAAKFPRKTSVAPYSQAKRIICDFLVSNSGDPDALNDDIQRLETRLRREPDGWMRDEILRNIAAIEAFQIAFKTTRAKRLRFVAGPKDVTMLLEGVRINTRMELSLIETSKEGVTFSGGVVMLIANADASRKKIEERRKTVAALTHWSLQKSSPNIETLERLCLSFDVFGNVATPASKSVERLRANVISSCREAAANWSNVQPPSGYDGPDWR